MKIPNNSIFQITINVHNLMINPDEVPNDEEWVLNEKGVKVYRSGGRWYCYSDYYLDADCSLCDAPKLWYDIPKFDIDTDKLELEKLSKEELIKLILKERGEK